MSLGWQYLWPSVWNRNQQLPASLLRFSFQASALKVLRGESWFPRMGGLRTLMRAVFPLSLSELHAFATSAHRAAGPGHKGSPTVDIRHPSRPQEAEFKVRRHLARVRDSWSPARLLGHLSYEMPPVALLICTFIIVTTYRLGDRFSFGSPLCVLIVPWSKQ